MAIARYIETLELSDIPAGAPEARIIVPEGGMSRGAVPTQADVAATHALPEKLSAAVNMSSVLSFVDGVAPDRREDIIYSVQFATRAASARFDRFAQPRDWYNLFVQILETVGWAAEQFAFAQVDTAEGEFRMDQAAIGVITAIATGNQLAVLKSSIDALGKLAENDGAISVFDFHSSTDLAGNFQVGSVEVGGTGVLSMAFGGFFFRAVDRRRRFLFFRWGKQDVNFWTAAEKMTFNVTLYDRVREKVKERLGAKALSVVEEIPLAGV